MPALLFEKSFNLLTVENLFWVGLPLPDILWLTTDIQEYFFRFPHSLL
jgi:hypothetical protein